MPDATPGFAVHVAYVRPPGAADRLADWAPRIVGDVAAIDAWWRSQDPARAPRFDLFPFACTSLFGQLDISSVTLQQPAGQIATAFTTLRFLLAEQGFIEPEKTYLVYYDGPLEQQRVDSEVCGVGGTPAGGLPGIAIVFLDSCEAEETHVSPDRRDPRAGAHTRRRRRRGAAPLQRRARLRRHQRLAECLPLRR